MSVQATDVRARLDVPNETVSIEREIEIAARPEIVWEFLVDPEKAQRWMGVAAALDPRPGGLYRVEITPGNVARGAFVVLDRPRRLVHTWGWEPGGEVPLPPGGSTVEIDLIANGSGGTTLRLRHHGLPAVRRDGHARGWEHYLPRLVVAAQGGDPGPDPWAAERTSSQPASSEAER